MVQGTAAPQTPPGPGGDKPSKFWIIYPNAFSKDECAQLIAICEPHETHKGGLVAGRFDAKVRQSALMWLPEDKEFDWVRAAMARIAADANRDQFDYALDGFDEQLQLAAYGPGHYYDWHIDRGQGAVAGKRKLTMSVQLTDPAQYLGGELELNASGRPFQMPRTQGTAVIFAAHTLHRVAPVIGGMRHSLVTWVHGPDFV